MSPDQVRLHWTRRLLRDSANCSGDGAASRPGPNNFAWETVRMYTYCMHYIMYASEPSVFVSRNLVTPHLRQWLLSSTGRCAVTVGTVGTFGQEFPVSITNSRRNHRPTVRNSRWQELPYPGGVLTPAVACGEALARRLIHSALGSTCHSWSFLPLWQNQDFRPLRLKGFGFHCWVWINTY